VAAQRPTSNSVTAFRYKQVDIVTILLEIVQKFLGRSAGASYVDIQRQGSPQEGRGLNRRPPCFGEGQAAAPDLPGSATATVAALDGRYRRPRSVVVNGYQWIVSDGQHNPALHLSLETSIILTGGSS
jgi:hypothetical protein